MVGVQQLAPDVRGVVRRRVRASGGECGVDGGVFSHHGGVARFDAFALEDACNNNRVL